MYVHAAVCLCVVYVFVCVYAAICVHDGVCAMNRPFWISRVALCAKEKQDGVLGDPSLLCGVSRVCMEMWLLWSWGL